MIKLENTPKALGITIKGDYYDLNELYDAVCQPADLYFTFIFNALKEKYPSNPERYEDLIGDYDYAHNCILGLCYDIRHAYQGDRDIEYMREDKNKYYKVDVLYPWMIYYLLFFKRISQYDFDEEDFATLNYPYNNLEHQKNMSILKHFSIQIWECLIKLLGEEKASRLYRLSTKKDDHILMEFSYVEAFCQYYCDANKRGKLIHKNMLLAFINECFNEKNDDYDEAIKKNQR